MRALYGGCVKEAHVHAVALDYDQDRWWSLFESLWPPGSPAHASYASRICDGGTLRLEEAVMETPAH